MKKDKLIMVVQRKILFGKDYFEGFRPQNEIDYESRILRGFRWMRRNIAEEDPTHKQPIAYLLIVNSILKKVFAYQRASKDKKYSEKRLQGRWSWGVGGHIEKFDNDEYNPIHASMLRELDEEVKINGEIKSRVLGYINDDKDDVGKVHFGVLYLIETNASKIDPKDPEIETGELKSIKGLEEICNSANAIVEGWSKLSLNPLKKYFDGL